MIVDADSQRVVAKFPATPAGDEDLIAYLRRGQPLADVEDASDASPDKQAAAQQRVPGQGSEPDATLRRALRENRAEQRNAAGRIADLKAQERDLLRVLRANQKRP